ncbi:MAG: serine/threonine-protein kinase [Sandaracinaceae bacterium]
MAERYRVEKPIGTGGMATIWEGMHLALNRPIAIKFIDIVGPNSERIRDRFLREARVAAAVHHRNVVDIVDFGTSEQGHPFMVMELLRGEPLSARLGSGPLPVADVVGILARLLSGLTAVHEAGIVHRDLKPENVFLVEEGDIVFPKLLDFGVSRALDPTGDLKSVLPTRENAIVGTPQYMSPEQARGLRALDQRSDLWSAGVILYELLSGQLPFDAEAIGDVIIQIATAAPPDFAQLRPDLAGPLEQVVKKAMQRDPADRFQTSREMRKALLAAAAKTAVDMDAPAEPGRVAMHSELPPMASQQLIDAVGEAYEPGDSGLLDFRDHPFSLDDGDEDSGLRPVPAGVRPVPPGGTSTSALSTPTRSPRWMPVLSVILLLLGAAGAGGGYVLLDRAGMLEPAAPQMTASELAPVRLSLRGVPEGAVVMVDGASITGSATDLPNDGATHSVSVRAADGRTWTETYVAAEDGSLDVQMPAAPPAPVQPAQPVAPASPEVPVDAPEAEQAAPVPVEDVAPRPRRRRARFPRRLPRRTEGTGLLRDPGY